MQNNYKRSFCISMGVILFFTLLMIFIFHNQWYRILELCKQVSFFSLFCVILSGVAYQLLEAKIFQTMLCSKSSNFPFCKCASTVYLGVFGNTALFTVGALPLQSYYLYVNGVTVGSGIGILTLEYVIHKLSVFIYSLGMLLFGWIIDVEGISVQLPFLLCAYSFIICVSLFLIALCTWKKAKYFLIKQLYRLPNTEKWRKRKTKWVEQLETLYQEANQLIRNKKYCGRAFIWNILKLFVLYSIPFFCMRQLQSTELTFLQVQILSSFMVLMTNAMPNIAGMGSAETAFLFVFMPYIGKVSALAALLLYRIATYYAPFFN